jgi:uncharacterized protein with ParB-like and HNH nuclease domain
MLNQYHKDIQNILSDICKKNTDKFLGGSSKKKIEINHPTKQRTSIIYYPDFVLISKQGHYYIFQILDSQSEHKDRTVANVINAYLSEQVKRLYFIIQDEKIRDQVSEIAEVVLDKIIELSKEDTIRSKLHVHYEIVPENSEKNTIKNSLEKALFIIPTKIEEDIKKLVIDDTKTYTIKVKNRSNKIKK